jgi:hypothetical protein
VFDKCINIILIKRPLLLNIRLTVIHNDEIAWWLLSGTQQLPTTVFLNIKAIAEI